MQTPPPPQILTTLPWEDTHCNFFKVLNILLKKKRKKRESTALNNAYISYQA